MSAKWTIGIAVTLLAALALPLTSCCKASKKNQDNSSSSDPDPEPTTRGAWKGTHFHFNRVPLEVDIPAGWKETQNTRNWAVFRPLGGGALVAFSPGTDCGAVEQRFYGALIELGLTNVNWEGGRKTDTVNGLRTTSAEGTAIETSQLSYVKYAITRSPTGRGCLATIYNVWKSKSGEYHQVGDKMFASISQQ
jgi:hypothetical protein